MSGDRDGLTWAGEVHVLRAFPIRGSALRACQTPARVVDSLGGGFVHLAAVGIGVHRAGARFGSDPYRRPLWVRERARPGHTPHDRCDRQKDRGRRADEDEQSHGRTHELHHRTGDRARPLRTTSMRRWSWPRATELCCMRASLKWSGWGPCERPATGRTGGGRRPAAGWCALPKGAPDGFPRWRESRVSWPQSPAREQRTV
jgi:hypothetical protein